MPARPERAEVGMLGAILDRHPVERPPAGSENDRDGEDDKREAYRQHRTTTPGGRHLPADITPPGTSAGRRYPLSMMGIEVCNLRTPAELKMICRVHCLGFRSRSRRVAPDLTLGPRALCSPRFYLRYQRESALIDAHGITNDREVETSIDDGAVIIATFLTN